jgi:hypothetical protein
MFLWFVCLTSFTTLASTLYGWSFDIFGPRMPGAKVFSFDASTGETQILANNQHLNGIGDAACSDQQFGVTYTFTSDKTALLSYKVGGDEISVTPLQILSSRDDQVLCVVNPDTHDLFLAVGDQMPDPSPPTRIYVLKGGQGNATLLHTFPEFGLLGFALLGPDSSSPGLAVLGGDYSSHERLIIQFYPMSFDGQVNKAFVLDDHIGKGGIFPELLGFPRSNPRYLYTMQVPPGCTGIYSPGCIQWIAVDTAPAKWTVQTLPRQENLGFSRHVGASSDSSLFHLGSRFTEADEEEVLMEFSPSGKTLRIKPFSEYYWQGSAVIEG